MKKVFMILLAAVLLLFLTGGVAAEATTVEITNVSQRDNATVTVTLMLNNDYKVTIPADFSLVKNANGEYSTPHSNPPTISATVTLLKSTQLLNVSVSSDNYTTTDSDLVGNWTLRNATGSAVLPYYMKATTATGSSAHISQNDINNKETNLVQNNEVILSLASGSGTVTKTIHILLAEDPTYLDTYTDQLKFTVSLPDSAVAS